MHTPPPLICGIGMVVRRGCWLSEWLMFDKRGTQTKSIRPTEIQIEKDMKGTMPIKN